MLEGLVSEFPCYVSKGFLTRDKQFSSGDFVQHLGAAFSPTSFTYLRINTA